MPFKGNVLYLEGFADSMLNHEPLFAAIADAGWRVVAFDYPGQGGSDGSMNDTSIAQILDLGDTVYQQCAKDPTTAKRVILGWSTGGLAAYCAAAKRRTNAAILLAPGIHVKLVGKVTLDTLTSRTFPAGADPHLDPIKSGSPAEAPFFAADLGQNSFLAQLLKIDPEVAGLAILTGPKDSYVMAAETRTTLARNAPHFSIAEVPHSLHEVDNEIDEIRQTVFGAVLQFLNML